MITHDETFLMDDEVEEAVPGIEEEADPLEDAEEEVPAEVADEEELL